MSCSSFEFNNDVDRVSLAIAVLPKSETKVLCAMRFVSLKKPDGPFTTTTAEDCIKKCMVLICNIVYLY